MIMRLTNPLPPNPAGHFNPWQLDQRPLTCEVPSALTPQEEEPVAISIRL